MKKVSTLFLLTIMSSVAAINSASSCDGYKTCLAVVDCVKNPKWHNEMMRVKGSGQGISDDTAKCQHEDNPGNSNFDGDSATCAPQNWEIIGRYAYGEKSDCANVPK
jgi:hypothetical protein